MRGFGDWRHRARRDSDHLPRPAADHLASPSSPTRLGARWRTGRDERFAAWIPALTLLIAGFTALPDIGLTTDEPLHHAQGDRLLRYYGTFGADRAAIETSNLRYYGGLFDLVAALGAHAVPALPWHAVKHGLTVVAGAVGALYAARTAALLGGSRLAWLTGILLAANPRWFGYALFNPKDIPFAAGYTAAIYYVARLSFELPAPRTRTWIGFSVATACALGVRFAGILPALFLALLITTRLARARVGRLPSDPLRVPALAAASSLAALMLGAVFWPYLHEHTWLHYLEVVTYQSNFPWDRPTLLLGRFYSPAEIGRLYLPVWLSVALPLPILLGALAALFALASGAQPAPDRRALALVALSALFPIGYIVARGLVLYGSMRHVLFVLPPLTVLAAAGLSWVWQRAWSRVGRFALGVALVAANAEPALWIVRSHPYAYTYLNPLAGSFAVASHRFETDHWRLASRRAADVLGELASSLPSGERLRVRTPHARSLIEPFLRESTAIDLVEGGELPEPDVALLLHPRAVKSCLTRRAGAILFAERIVADQLPFFVIERVSERLPLVPLVDPWSSRGSSIRQRGE